MNANQRNENEIDLNESMKVSCSKKGAVCSWSVLLHHCSSFV